MSIWTRFRPEDVRRLRIIGRQALLRQGVLAEQLDENPHEVDKWLESRLESTLEKIVKVCVDRGIA